MTCPFQALLTKANFGNDILLRSKMAKFISWRSQAKITEAMLKDIDNPDGTGKMVLVRLLYQREGRILVDTMRDLKKCPWTSKWILCQPRLWWWHKFQGKTWTLWAPVSTTASSLEEWPGVQAYFLHWSEGPSCHLGGGGEGKDGDHVSQEPPLLWPENALCHHFECHARSHWAGLWSGLQV